MQNKAIYELISKQYSTPQEVMSEIINLQAILNLPKGTEHFLSDLHGESETFFHLLRNASGVIRTKIEQVFGDSLSEEEQKRLASVIYYPEEQLARMHEQGATDADYELLLNRLIEITKLVASKYTRSKVRKSLPDNYRYIIDELINMPYHSINKSEYYSHIISGIIELKNTDNFITEICHLIQRLSIDHLHIVGDIFDRGNGGDVILEHLRSYHSLDIEWGNHDVLWMGASFGNAACICSVIRINCMYRNLQVIENYGINLRPLVTYATEVLATDPCELFHISDVYGQENKLERNETLAKMTKAITVIQLKLENQLIRCHPEFFMTDRIKYPDDTLTEGEHMLIDFLVREFTSNVRLQEHVRFLLRSGSMYKVYNGNLLMHGCVPTEADGSFSAVCIDGQAYRGRALYDRLDRLVRDAGHGDPYAIDYMWYLWCGKKSPLYGRDKMCVYEKYFEGRSIEEIKDPYYTHIQNEAFCLKVLKEFGVEGDYSIIVNGHTPVRVKSGELPESGNGRHITIDGGLSHAYYEKTGIGGYTLISNSQGLFLVSHMPLPEEDESGEFKDIKSETRVLRRYDKRIMIKETDKGREMSEQILILKDMLRFYYGRK